MSEEVGKETPINIFKGNLHWKDIETGLTHLHKKHALVSTDQSFQLCVQVLLRKVYNCDVNIHTNFVAKIEQDILNTTQPWEQQAEQEEEQKLHGFESFWSVQRRSPHPPCVFVIL